MQLRVSVEREPRNPEYFFSFSGSSCLPVSGSLSQPGPRQVFSHPEAL